MDYEEEAEIRLRAGMSTGYELGENGELRHQATGNVVGADGRTSTEGGPLSDAAFKRESLTKEFSNLKEEMGKM